MTQAALDARNAAMNGAVGEYADALYSFRKLLPSLYSDKPGFEMPELVLDNPADPANSNSNYKRMAKALLDDGKVNIQGKDGQTIQVSLDDGDPDSLDARDTRQGGIFKNSLGVRNLNAIGSGKRASGFADAVQDAVEKNSSDIGFLKGASIMNALSGLIQWVLGGFKGGMTGLMQTIATVTAENIRTDLTENLKGKGYTHDEVKKAGDAAYYATLDKAGFADPKAPKKITDPRNITAITMNDAKVQEMRNTVYDTVLNQRDEKDQKNLTEKIADKFVSNKRSGFLSNNFGWVRGVTEAKLTNSAGKVASNIAANIADFTTNPDSSQRLVKMPREQYAAAVADNAVEGLRRDQASFGLPDALTDAQLNQFREEIRAGVIESYDKLHTATSLAATNVKQPTLASATNSAFEQAKASLGQNNAGISGASQANDGSLGELGKQSLAAKNAGKAETRKPGAPPPTSIA